VLSAAGGEKAKIIINRIASDHVLEYRTVGSNHAASITGEATLFMLRGKTVCHLWHAGRLPSMELQPVRQVPVALFAIPAIGNIRAMCDDY
jgi:hypothetical protein